MSLKSILAILLLGTLPALACAQEADVQIGLSGPETAAADSDASYRIRIDNIGPDAADTLSWNYALPAGLGFVSLTQDSGTPWSCTTPAVGAGGSIDCTLATLASGDAAEFSLVLNVPVGTAVGSSFSHTVNVVSAFDPNVENDSSSLATRVPEPTADVHVELIAPYAVGSPGALVYTIDIGNAGPDAAADFNLAYTLPGTLTFASLNQSSGPSLSCSTPSVGSGGSIACSLGSLPADSRAQLVLTADVPAATASGTEFNGAVVVSTSTHDSAEENDAASHTASVSNVDLGTTLTAAATADAGTQLSYVLSVDNAGPDVAVNVDLRSQVPAGATLVSLTQDSGTSMSCLRPAIGAAGEISCLASTLGAGASAQFTLVVQIEAAVPHGSVLANSATVSSSDFDADAANNSSSAATTISNTVDLQLGDSGPTLAHAGRNASYTLSLGNSGPDAATNVVLSDSVPADTGFVSLQQTAGATTFNCTTPAVGASGAISCTAPSLASGASVEFQLTVLLSTALADGATITHSASVGNDVPESDPGDNAASSLTPVQNRADLQLASSAPASLSAGETLTVVLTAQNLGESPAQSVVLSTTTPPLTTLISFTPAAGFSCTTPAIGGSGAISCENSLFAAGGSAQFTLVAALPASTANGSVVQHSASIVGSTLDPEAGNNSTTASSLVASRADLQVAISNGVNRLVQGQTTIYAVVAANAGPADAINAVIDAPLPAGLGTASWACVQAQSTATCPTASAGTGNLYSLVFLPANSYLRYDLMATVTAAAPSSVSSTATLAAPAGLVDQDPSNNSATDTDPVAAAALFYDGFESPPVLKLSVPGAVEAAEVP